MATRSCPFMIHLPFCQFACANYIHTFFTRNFFIPLLKLSYFFWLQYQNFLETSLHEFCAWIAKEIVNDRDVPRHFLLGGGEGRHFDHLTNYCHYYTTEFSCSMVDFLTNFLAISKNIVEGHGAPHAPQRANRWLMVAFSLQIMTNLSQ